MKNYSQSLIDHFISKYYNYDQILNSTQQNERIDTNRKIRQMSSISIINIICI